MRMPCGYSFDRSNSGSLAMLAANMPWPQWSSRLSTLSGETARESIRFAITRSMIRDYRKTWRNWPERHPWVTLIAIPVAGILAAILIATLQDYQAKQAERVRVNTEIDRIIQTAADFDPIVHRYITLARAGDPQANGYHDKILNDPSVSRMNDVIAKPVTQWPSIESCDAFRAYYRAAFDLLVLSVDKRPIMTLDEAVKAYDGKLETLQKALNTARR
jgi:hypothetical protein